MLQGSKLNYGRTYYDAVLKFENKSSIQQVGK